MQATTTKTRATYDPWPISAVEEDAAADDDDATVELGLQFGAHLVGVKSRKGGLVQETHAKGSITLAVLRNRRINQSSHLNQNKRNAHAPLAGAPQRRRRRCLAGRWRRRRRRPGRPGTGAVTVTQIQIQTRATEAAHRDTHTITHHSCVVLCSDGAEATTSSRFPECPVPGPPPLSLSSPSSAFFTLHRGSPKTGQSERGFRRAGQART